MNAFVEEFKKDIVFWIVLSIGYIFLISFIIRGNLQDICIGIIFAVAACVVSHYNLKTKSHFKFNRYTGDLEN